jgi:hypothetical protein
MIEWLIVGALLSLVLIDWEAIQEWFQKERQADPQAVGEMIRVAEQNGDVVYVGGVFNRQGQKIAQKRWAESEVADDVKDRFQGRKRIRI